MHLVKGQTLNFANLEDMMVYSNGEISYAECQKRLVLAHAREQVPFATAFVTELDPETGGVSIDTAH
jgi:hypothetical protein